MITSAATTQKTVHLNNSEKYWRKLDNTTLRIKIPGEDMVTAKDILLDALTCEDDWLFTTKNIADRWGIAFKTAAKKMALLSKCGHAKPEKIVDPKTNKILMHIWIFFEKPYPPKEGCMAPYDGTRRDKKKITPKATTPQVGGCGTYLEKEQKKEQQRDERVEPVVVSLNKKLKPEHRKTLSQKLISESIECFDRKPDQLEILIDRINNTPGINCAGAYFRRTALDRSVDLPTKTSADEPAQIDLGEHRRLTIESRKPPEYEPISVEEMRRMTAERRGTISDDRQYQTSNTSGQALPAKAPKKPAYKREKTSFLRAKLEFLSYVEDLGLRGHFEKQNDSRLAQSSEFVRFCYEKGFQVDD